MIKTPLLVQGLQVQSLVGELRSHMPLGKESKHKTNNIETNSIKTLKMVHIKKSLKQKNKENGAS